MAADQQVTVKFLSDTKGYVRGVREAEKAQDKLTQAVKETNTQTELSVDETGALTESFGDLNTAVTQTSEGLIDSATGFSGLGAALTSIGTRVTSAIRALSGFQKALIATGIGAALVALGLILVFWEDIAEAIGVSTFNLEKFNEQNARELTFLENKLKILEDTGAQQELIDNARIAVLAQEIKAAKELLEEREKEVERRNELNRSQGIAILSLERMDELLEDQFDSVVELEQQVDLATAAMNKYLNEIDDATISTLELVDATDLLAEANARATQDAIEDEEEEFIAGQTQEEKEAARIAKLLVDLDKEAGEQIEKDRQDSRDREAKDIANKSAADLQLAKDLAASKDTVIQSSFALASQLAGDSAELNLILDLAQAAAGVAVGIVNSFKLTPPLSFINAAIVAATGIAQTIAIKKAYSAAGASGGSLPSSVGATTAADGRSRAVFEEGRVSDRSLQANRQSQVVLITEDLDRVQNRVAVTESRSSI